MRKTNARILVVDDNPEVLIAARMMLKRHFETVLTHSAPKALFDFFSKNTIDVLILDMNFRVGYEDGKEGIFWFKEIRKIAPETQIILMTSFAHIETAVEGIKLGATDYILKPWDNEALVQTVKNAVKQSRNKMRPVQSPIQEENSYFVGTAPSVRRVYKMAERVAQTDVNALILGENGTGKYVLAQHIHRCSPRNKQPFIHVDLGSLHENLFESELFGYAKGAFTDAQKDTIGRFEAAHGGTIFLDEIGNVPVHLQAKLLQVIQSKSVVRLGESIPRPIDVRILTATNLDIEQEVTEKNFREDLFYRINTVTLLLPPLRERQEDIAPLLDFFLKRYATKYDRSHPRVSAEAIEFLLAYDWRGNIRELQNRVERALILSEEDTLCLADFGITDTSVYGSLEAQGTLLELEKQRISKTLEKHQGNISHSAEELGLSRAALYRRMEKFNLKK